MLFLILFWVALALGFVSWIGAIAEKSTGMVCAALGFAVIALVSAASLQWL